MNSYLIGDLFIPYHLIILIVSSSIFIAIYLSMDRSLAIKKLVIMKKILTKIKENKEPYYSDYSNKQKLMTTLSLKDLEKIEKDLTLLDIYEQVIAERSENKKTKEYLEKEQDLDEKPVQRGKEECDIDYYIKNRLKPTQKYFEKKIVTYRYSLLITRLVIVIVVAFIVFINTITFNNLFESTRINITISLGTMVIALIFFIKLAKLDVMHYLYKDRLNEMESELESYYQKIGIYSNDNLNTVEKNRIFIEHIEELIVKPINGNITKIKKLKNKEKGRYS